jgi:type 1 glutamine amidotransferase/sugar phosphate isomerase/epimerase
MKKCKIAFKHKLAVCSAAFFVLCSLIQPLHAQVFVKGSEADAFFSGIPDNFKTQIERALPKSAPVEVDGTKKLLVVNLNAKYKDASMGHHSIPYANYALHKMGEKTGAFETYFCKDTLVFQRETLEQFDAICLNNTVGVIFDDEELRQNLLDFVYGGKGIMGIHAGAGATFVQYPVYDQFPEFGRMMGGYENGGHPWKTHEWINVKIEDPGHPLNKGFNYPDFNVSDEIYQYAEPYSRDKVRVLLSVNTDKTDVGPNRWFLPERKLDMDFPISWVKSYGKGRVFNSAFGHHPHINWDMRLLDQTMRAIQFILGDLDAPTTPDTRLTASVIAQEQLGWRLGMTAYSFKDKTFLETVDETADLGLLYVGGLNVQKVSPDINQNFDYKLDKETLYSIRQHLLAKGVNLVTYYIHDIPADEKVCREIFEFGRIMGIETFISEPKPEALDLIEKYCEEYNIKVALHNHGKDISPVYWDPDQLLKACEGRSPLIGACGDIGYWTRNRIDPKIAIEKLGKRLLTLQVHDLNEQSPEGHDVPWGAGTSDLDNFFRLIKDMKLKPSLIGLEYSYNWGASKPEIERSIKFFDATVTQIVAREQ